MMRATLLLLPCILASCGGGDGTTGGPNGAIAEVVQVSFDKPLGAQRATAWTVNAGPTCFALTHDDGLFIRNASISQFEKRGHGPLTDPPIWKRQIPDLHYGDCPLMYSTVDGGAVFIAGNPDLKGAHVQVTRLASDGTLLWAHAITDQYPRGDFASTVLSNGTVAVAFDYEPAGQLGPVKHFVVLLGADGNEQWRTEIPTIHVESADSPGGPGNGTSPPGTGFPSVLAMAETTDGGLFLAGQYWFYRAIECGTEKAPETPHGTSCGSDRRNGLVARLDATGKLSWSKRLGVVYDGGTLAFEFAAALTDGSVMATGWIIPEKEGVEILHQQALAARYDSSGGLVWAKAFPYGPAPGATFFAQSKFDRVVAREAGAADVVLRTPDMGECRLLRFEPGGAISRIQILPGCITQALGAELAQFYFTAKESGNIAKLAP